MFQWLRKRPPAPRPAPDPAPGQGRIGINVRPESLAAQHRVASRMVRLIDAMAKAARKGDPARVDALDDELQRKRQRLLAVGTRAPYKRDDLVELRDELEARMRAGKR